VKYYEDSSLARLDTAGSNNPRNDHIMLYQIGVEKIGQIASTFAHMADNFNEPPVAEMSHFPGINVLYLDSHVSYYVDTTDDGSVLYYNNGIPGRHHNWEHDRAWMHLDEVD